jgi:hypothetical protein
MFDETVKTGLSFPGTMELCFVSIKSGLPLVFRMTQDSTNNATVLCDDMEIVSELVQDLCFKLGVRFPAAACCMRCVPCHPTRWLTSATLCRPVWRLL